MTTPDQKSRFLADAKGLQGTAGSAAGAEWTVRQAGSEDVAGCAAGIAALLEELGSQSPSREEMEGAARALVERPELGTLLLVEAGGEVVGVLAASWVHAVHVPGHYGVVQDLWVRPDFRSRSVGHDLVEAYAEIARAGGAARLEVGLPRESFAGIRSTEAFYLGNEFSALGMRMRRKLR